MIEIQTRQCRPSDTFQPNRNVYKQAAKFSKHPKMILVYKITTITEVTNILGESCDHAVNVWESGGRAQVYQLTPTGPARRCL